MRLFCLERDNVTQPCDLDSDGDVYTSSFELFPFHEGATYSLYTGVYNGRGPYAGQFCAVRSLLDIEATPAHWHAPLVRAREACRLAHEFNRELAYPAIFFNVPVLTRMETVSDFNSFFRCFKPHDKRLKLGECVTLEPYLEGDFLQFDQSAASNQERQFRFVTSSGQPPGEPDIIEHACSKPLSTSGSSKHKTINSTSSIAQAFSHFCWHQTGSHIVCGLQGILNGLTYTLTNPIVHSVGGQFGAPDGGNHAIAEFFRRHRCNNICRTWEKYEPHRNALPQVNFLNNPASDPRLYKQQQQQQQQHQRSRRRDNNQKYAQYYNNFEGSFPTAPGSLE